MADASQPLLAATRQRVKAIIRRDLKLGDIDIADDMPFFNSETDLDSLDMLLLVTSIEREFGIKIPSQEVGEAVFRNVESLTRYVAERSSAGAGAAVGPEVLQRLPHREPFRFVTQVTNLREGESGEGVWTVTGQEAFLAGHFPTQPMVPGVLIAEALAQLSGLISGSSVAGGHGKLAHVDVRFEQAVIPPADITLKSRLMREMGQLRQYEVSAAIGNVPVASGTLALHLSPPGAS